MNWTDSQREAIETRGQRVLVSAGAGSGKTRVLVERFLRLLEENPTWRVPDIVAVTFTEKAAREMVSRIRREIRSRIEQSRASDERARWREHRNAMDSARIGTIHSLCASILRAHSAEAALDPTFEVIEEIESAALLNQAIEDAIADAARDISFELSPSSDSPHYSLTPDPRLPTPVEVLAYLSTYDARSAVRALVAQGEKASRAISRVPVASSDEVFDFWQQKLDEMKTEAALALIELDEWKGNAQIITRLAARNPDDKREQCRADVARLLADISREIDSAGERAGVAQKLVDIESRINLRGGSKKNWDSEEEFEAVKEALKTMREMVEAEKILFLELNEADRVAAFVTAGLIKLSKAARARFAALKRQQNALDFNDLEEMTEQMLASHKEVRHRYSDAERGLIRAMMVDEFQDTSPVQKRLLWMLAPRSSELFIIGDPKQSIYRFRGADVTVFNDARQEFANGSGREIGLDACFRAHERLIDFLNHVFNEVLALESRYDTPYEAMTAKRQPAGRAAAVELHIIAQDESSETRLGANELREAEARFIARRIKEIAASGEVSICQPEGGARGAEYGDFALLFQASTSFEIYEQALADAGVPYVTIAGRGFYDRQEITDLTSLLAFLASPIDSLRLAAVLRSPMFALSDETLFWLRRKHQPLWKSLSDESITHQDAEREAVEFARAALARLLQLAGRLSAAELIVAALEETSYLATLMALPHGERRVANIEKFVEQARELSSMTLSELVELTKEMRFNEAREGEATIEEAGAVRLMTVHKSKGLEFPIVWMADATYRGASDRSIIALHPEHGISVRITGDHIETDNDRLCAASFEMLKRVEERMDAAEKKRLLYVAATRARDHLIMSGAMSRAKINAGNWLGKMMAALGVDEEDRPESVAYPGGHVHIGWHDAQTILSGAQVDRGKSAIATSDSSTAVDECSPEADQSNQNLFPLIKPLTPR